MFEEHKIKIFVVKYVINSFTVSAFSVMLKKDFTFPRQKYMDM